MPDDKSIQGYLLPLLELERLDKKTDATVVSKSEAFALFILPPKLKEFTLYNCCQLSCHTQIWYGLIVPNFKATFYYYGI